MGLKDLDIDWYCDKCDSCLNDQSGFSTSGGTWICKNCGYPNDVTYGNVLWDNETLDSMTTDELMEISDACDEYDRNN